MTVKTLVPIKQEPDESGFWSSLSGFIRAYPWQTAMFTIGFIAIMVNIASTKKIIKALQFRR